MSGWDPLQTGAGTSGSEAVMLGGGSAAPNYPLDEFGGHSPQDFVSTLKL